MNNQQIVIFSKQDDKTKLEKFYTMIQLDNGAFIANYGQLGKWVKTKSYSMFDWTNIYQARLDHDYIIERSTQIDLDAYNKAKSKIDLLKMEGDDYLLLQHLCKYGFLTKSQMKHANKLYIKQEVVNSVVDSVSKELGI